METKQEKGTGVPGAGQVAIFLMNIFPVSIE